MTSEGFGKSQPIAGTVQNQTEEQRAKNRRVTIVKTN
jgi:outer membrane protein OmpA-like peptidoglycan-associated protein